MSDLEPGQRPALDTDEAGLWMQMDNLEKSLRRLGDLYGPGFREAAEEQLAGMDTVLAGIKQSAAENGTAVLQGRYRLLSAYGLQLSYMQETDGLISSIMQTGENR